MTPRYRPTSATVRRSSYFSTEKAKAQAQAQIAKTDNEIDALVYQLYGLTAEEITVVEGK